MRLAATVLLLSFSVTLAAHASDREFNKLVKAAEQLYSAGKYKDSAERLIEAYAYKPHPRLIYNIARAYDQAGELELSLEFYQRYINSQEGTDPTLLKRSSLSIDRLRGLLSQREQRRGAEAAEQARLEAEAKAARANAEKEAEAKRRAEKELLSRKQADSAARSRSKIAAFALGGVAIAGLGTGTVFGLQANGSRSQFSTAETVAVKEELRGRTQSQALIADVGFGAGVVAAIAAVILYPKGSDDVEAPSDAPSAILVPGPNGAGLQVRF